ncbi:MAG: hypothetical protein ABF294_10120 [Flavobacteriales bacterium]
MKPFLKRLVETVKSEHQDIGKVTLVVPTQRSGVYIKKYLSEVASETTYGTNPIEESELFSVLIKAFSSVLDV